MSTARVLTVLLLAGALAGCAREGPPAEVVDAQNALAPPAAAPARPAPAPTETAGGNVTVRPGQTLYSVARDANVPVRTLIDANQLQPPYRLRTGQVLAVPRTRQHVVQPGETLYAVARQYGVEASSLARENHLNPPYTIKSGAVLMLPAPAEPAIAMAVLPPPASPVAISVAPLPPPAKPAPPLDATRPPPEATHAPTPLQPANNPPPQNVAAPPAAVAAPAPIAASPSAAAPPETTAPPAPQPAAPAAKPETQAQAAPAAPPPVDTAKPDPAKPDSVKPAPVPEAVAAAIANHPDPVPPLFQWPVRGRILSVFGTSTTGAQNDGINIVAPSGTTVSAAEGGVVAYAGNELRGFGNLLLIKHADGWVTAYAHNEVLLVKKGDKVRRGQPIARVGNSGGVAQAQLHFELRRGTKAIDPLDHLPAQSADAG